MSWSGFKKAVNRGGTTLLQKTGQIERTDDSTWKHEEQTYRELEKSTNALQKDAKQYLDAIRATSGSSSRIAATVDLFFGSESGEQAMAANAYKRAVEEMEGNITRSIDAPYRATVLEPIGKLCSYWPEVNNTISKRNKKLLDYDAARSKARKLSDKPSDDASKLPRAEQESETAREIFEAIDHTLRADIPVLLELRIPYLDPSLECMVRMQTHFASDGYEKLGGVQRYFAEGVRDDYAAGRLDQQVEQCLHEMQQLSIVGIGTKS